MVLQWRGRTRSPILPECRTTSTWAPSHRKPGFRLPKGRRSSLTVRAVRQRISSLSPVPPQVAETCQLAVKRLEWMQENREAPGAGPYCSVDPAPPAREADVEKLRQALLDEAKPLFERYRAMFALRNLGGEAAVLALADGEQSSLFLPPGVFWGSFLHCWHG